MYVMIPSDGEQNIQVVFRAKPTSPVSRILTRFYLIGSILSREAFSLLFQQYLNNTIQVLQRCASWLKKTIPSEINFLNGPKSFYLFIYFLKLNSIKNPHYVHLEHIGPATLNIFKQYFLPLLIPSIGWLRIYIFLWIKG